MDTATLPRIGEKAPEFQAQSTHGMICFPADFKGKWVVLLSHPGAFNPVCASEFQEMARLQNQFAENNCALVAFSPDSAEAHAAWMRELEKDAPGGAETFAGIPLVADDGGVIARQYGVLPQGAARPVRGVFFMDPQATIRAVLLYPRGVGRSTGEILRLLLALQAFEADGMPIPANWGPEAKGAIRTPQPNTGDGATQSMDSHQILAAQENSWSFQAEPISVQPEPQVTPDAVSQPGYAAAEAVPDTLSNSAFAQESPKPPVGNAKPSRQQLLHPVSQSAWDALAQAQPQMLAPEQALRQDAVPSISSFVHTNANAAFKPSAAKSDPSVQTGSQPAPTKTGGSIADQNRRLLGDLLDKEDAENGDSPDGRDYLIMRDFPYKK
ncbi:peroxiredoxin [Ethanoligenens harbinense]|uniref:Alkyl hydroperoxide reductase/ Thiol specific antioxidant/ Mal allergen n=1 Tax=Ethanoligenens harbinense (strain DSM 18485 / JCM 12961 / CGMCC 1.5033 / YUAN-3) TaxID=663278 RepID=E6U6W9_ETHHY|nr:redoxin domain-containing protein [Ethanoligenens harbinense]ADU26936.1 alkyl hydroperoxide reductase/ Thiol specific antioxidant/ Mal allergen [Ethanoligenens harbinense YUAN-3]